MKKKKIANFIMVLLIFLMVGAGVFAVGHVRGWFDTDDGERAVLKEIRGVVHLMRDGVDLAIEQETVLRPGDRITSQNGATAVLAIGDSKLILGSNAAMSVKDPAVDSFSADVETGEVFAHCESSVLLTVDTREVVLAESTTLISVRSGAQSFSVLRGQVSDAESGQMVEFIGGEKSVRELPVESLNDFTITQIRALNSSALCFTLADLDALAEKRQQALQDLLNEQKKSENTSDDTVVDDVVTDSADQDNTVGSDSTQTDTVLTPGTSADAENNTGEPAVTPSPTPDDTTQSETPPPANKNCTIAIFCDTILNNMGDLEPGKAEFVPVDGVILAPVTVAFSDGETVFDVLQRVCSQVGIQLEYSWTPLYDSYYVEGINNLYEFDCGFESGWMYEVNDWFPNYGCSSYSLADGDVIVWRYTCKGLGTDVGAPRMD